MLRKRIIFSLIYSDGFFNQSRNFRLQKVGDIKWLENNYKFSHIAHSIDELIILDASRGVKTIELFAKNIEKVVEGVFIPICAGGGIRSLKDAELLFKSGADKIIINTILIRDTLLVKELVKLYGSQSIVASIDYKKNENTYDVFINNGSEKIKCNLSEYLEYIQSLGVGEIYLNSIVKDGTGFGYDLEVIGKVSEIIKIPLIIAGGAGNESHLLEGLKNKNISAVATANLFNFIGNGLPNARKKILNEGINLSNWEL